MHRSKLALSFLAALTCALAAGAPSHAQTLTTLASFNGTDGSEPADSVTVVGSTLYGMTYAGGANGDGTVFSLPVTGGTPTVLASFNGTNGANPEGNLTVVGSTLYGMTQYGGASGDGTIFSIPVMGGTPTVMASFNYTNGANPLGSLTLDGSKLYGMAQSGGTGGVGTLFSIPVSGGSISTLVNFTNLNGAGAIPTGSLTLSADGSTFYGMTHNGGNGEGNVFSVPVTGGTPTNLDSFSFGSPTGAEPYGDLTLSADGSTLYGMTQMGLAPNFGDIFSLPVTGGTPTILYSFGLGSQGALPYGDLTLVGSTLYGMTPQGGLGYGDGNIFSIPVTGGTLTNLHVFTGTDGAYPFGSLTPSADGLTFYGMTQNGGATYVPGLPPPNESGDGTVFALTLPTPEPSAAVLLGIGALGLGATALRRKMRKRVALGNGRQSLIRPFA